MSEDILTIRDVAEYLKVTEKTVYGLAQKGKMPCFKVGGQWRFKRQDIDEWIESQKQAAVQKEATEPEAEQPSDDASVRGER